MIPFDGFPLDLATLVGSSLGGRIASGLSPSPWSVLGMRPGSRDAA